MTTKQINDITYKIISLDGQAKVRNERIEQIMSDIEYLVLHNFEKDKLDDGDLEEINRLRFDYMTEAYRHDACRRQIVSLKKAAGIDLDEEDLPFA